MRLGADGESVILDGFDAAAASAGGFRPPAAVRYAWRAYPCEVLGCGVYTKIGDALVPPATFHMRVGGGGGAA